MVGNDCFKNVGVLKLIGLKKLEKVMIGNDCFTKENGSFTLKECDSLKELKIGMESFINYSRFIVKNLPSLEEMVIGEGVDYSNCFTFSSLELKGEGMEHEVKNRLSKTDNTQDWCWLFQEVRTSVD